MCENGDKAILAILWRYGEFGHKVTKVAVQNQQIRFSRCWRHGDIEPFSADMVICVKMLIIKEYWSYCGDMAN